MDNILAVSSLPLPLVELDADNKGTSPIDINPRTLDQWCRKTNHRRWCYEFSSRKARSKSELLPAITVPPRRWQPRWSRFTCWVAKALVGSLGLQGWLWNGAKSTEKCTSPVRPSYHHHFCCTLIEKTAGGALLCKWCSNTWVLNAL